ncbi:hypothetical protein APR04_003815 [Promicromonospora umidemergens]|uniref:Uncharacterized protein n=1 Tax=Promicromonospora umidemergens TaxID=629679 RepID=A0ABP8XJI6_9MICO|nr:hypothetical protein [Promicromonospora umidemergens]MCP2284892.1 hypothetical protein [Promicromonospora umidemergens]
MTDIARTEAQEIEQYRAERRAELVGDIRATYESLACEPGAWVGLARLRAALADVPRANLDAALLEMAREPAVMIIPEFNQKTLTPADRAAALRMGGENVHLLAVRLGRR